MKTKRFTLLLAVSLGAAGFLTAAPLADDIRSAVQQVRASDGVQPRQPFYLLEQAVPKAAGDVEQRLQLAKLLVEVVTAPDTTPAARTVLCQHLAKVAGEAERPLLSKLLADPATAADARIALGEAVGPPAKPEAEAAYLARVSDAKPSVRVAALAALAAFYPKAAVAACAKALRDPAPSVAATAIQRLARLDGAALAAELSALAPPRQALALDALAEGKVAAARDTAARLTDSPDEAVKQAAVRALGVVGDAGSVALLARLGAADALAQLNAVHVDEALLKVIAAAGGPASPHAAGARVVAMSAAVARGIPGLTPVLLRAAADADATVRTTALKLLGRSGEVSAYPQLVAQLGGADGEAVEDAALLMGRRMTDRAARLAPLLARLQGGEMPSAVRIAVLRVVAPLGGEDALAPVRAGLASADAAVRDAAVRALAAWPDPAAVPELRNVEGDAKASAVHRTLATRALDRLAASWTRYAALAYLDCGPANAAAGKEGVTLRVAAGKAWIFAEQPDGTVAYDGNEVVVEAAGLKPGRAYQLGFSWWDYDANGRVQSVWVGGQQVLAKTALPAWKGKQETAATLAVAIPAAAVKDGKATIRFRREAASNAVVGEVWVTDAASSRGTGILPVSQGPSGVAHDRQDAHATAIAPPAVKANAGAAKKVLLVTGLEYPGHPWRQTAPALAGILAQDKRLEVSLTEDPRTLAQPTLGAYDVIVLNYQNHEVSAPEGALANLKKAVEGGKGLVLFHFACGAFIDWPTKTVAADFGVIAGRVWNPKLRGHDPRGPFRVHIADASHPITQGLSDFDTEDELYTCLDGSAPIQILATATSKVDHKAYPMAFVLTPGTGRTFHCVLGHDLKALNDAVGALYRRGTAWAAGLE